MEKYLQTKGYKIISAERKVDEYQLTQEKLTTLPYMLYWGLQSVDPTPYLGKTVQVYKFKVKNHPLGYKSSTKKYGKETDLYVYEIEQQVIGGMSTPADEKLDGGMWSLEGKTLEDVQGKDFPVWRDEWLEKWGH